MSFDSNMNFFFYLTHSVCGIKIKYDDEGRSHVWGQLTLLLSSALVSHLLIWSRDHPNPSSNIELPTLQPLTRLSAILFSHITNTHNNIRQLYWWTISIEFYLFLAATWPILAARLWCLVITSHWLSPHYSVITDDDTDDESDDDEWWWSGHEMWVSVVMVTRAGAELVLITGDHRTGTLEHSLRLQSLGARPHWQHASHCSHHHQQPRHTHTAEIEQSRLSKKRQKILPPQIMLQGEMQPINTCNMTVETCVLGVTKLSTSPLPWSWSSSGSNHW